LTTRGFGLWLLLAGGVVACAHSAPAEPEQQAKPRPAAGSRPPRQASDRPKYVDYVEKRRREACDAAVVAALDVSRLFTSSLDTAQCPAIHPAYEARLLALREESLVQARPCARSYDLRRSFEWERGPAFERASDEIDQRFVRRCRDAMAAVIRAAKELTPETELAIVSGPGTLVECAVGEELDLFARRGAAEQAQILDLANRAGMITMPILVSRYGQAPRTEALGYLRSRCRSGDQALLARSIAAGHEIGDEPAAPLTPTKELLPTLPPVTVTSIPECNQSNGSGPTTFLVSVKCFEGSYDQETYVQGGVGNCSDTPGMLGQCYRPGGNVTRKVSLGPIAEVDVALVVDGVTLGRKLLRRTPKTYQAEVKQLAQEVYAEAFRKRELERAPVLAANRARAAAAASAEERRLARAARAREARERFDRATTPEEREEAAAAHVMAGGRDSKILKEVARLYGVPADPSRWPWSESRAGK
jgi:hypothetical protein